MDDQVKTLDDYLTVLRRRKFQLLAPALLLSIVAVLAALLIPPTYRSSATILIEQQEIPVDLVRSTVSSFADQRIQVISQRVMTTSNLSEIITRYNLYPDLRRKQSINAAVLEMRDAIDRKMISADVIDPRSGRAQQATIAFSLSYDNESANLAQKVTNDLVSLFLKENIEQRQAAVDEASAFLGSEAKKLKDLITSLESQLAAFKEEHGNNLPEFATLNRELMARTEERLRDNAQAARTLEEQRVYLESELAQVSPKLGANARGGAADASPEAHLRELETRYVGVAARYTPEHPDRVQLEREIDSLRRQVGESDTAVIAARLAELTGQLAVLRKRYSDTHPDVATLKRAIAASEAELAAAKRSSRSPSAQRQIQTPDNPIYVQLRTKFDGTRLEIQSLQQSRAKLEGELARLEALITEAPRIEQEYKALARDYDNAMAKYKEVRDKEMQAQLAKSLESDRKGERFLLIEPPLLPEKAYKPNRPAILVLGLLLSVAAGAGNLALREVLDQGLRSARAVFAITGVQPLAVIPYIETLADRRRRSKRFRRWTLTIVFTLAAIVAAEHFFLIPLDILWFMIVRRIELLMPTMTDQPAS